MSHTPIPLTPIALSISDFTRATSISRSGAYNLIRDGKLKAVKIGGRTVIPYAEAERLIRGAV